MINIGVFALQGAVELHRPHLEALGVNMIEVKLAKDFNKVDAFILPGGESTTMLKLISVFNLKEIMLEEFKRKPVWGICAGSILLAKHVINPTQFSFDLIDIDVVRNGYGSQIFSHELIIDNYPVSHIRAPIFQRVGEGVTILAEVNHQAVWLRQNNIVVSSFHPELTEIFPSPMHRYFVDMVKETIKH